MKWTPETSDLTPDGGARSTTDMSTHLRPSARRSRQHGDRPTAAPSRSSRLARRRYDSINGRNRPCRLATSSQRSDRNNTRARVLTALNPTFIWRWRNHPSTSSSPTATPAPSTIRSTHASRQLYDAFHETLVLSLAHHLAIQATLYAGSRPTRYARMNRFSAFSVERIR